METRPEESPSPWLGRNEFVPYEPGQGDAGRTGVVRLSANENPRGASPQVVRALRDFVGRSLAKYPQDGSPALRSDIAGHLNVLPCQVYPAAGAAGVIKAIAERTLLPGDEVVLSSMSFPYYEIAAAQQGARCTRAPVHDDMSDDLEGILGAITARTKTVFVASPNNPTGRYLSETDLLDWLRCIPGRIVVALDLAYLEYADVPYENGGVGLLEAHPNLILIRSFSKVHGLASLRVGYGVGRPETINEISKAAMPFGVSGPGVVAARAALADERWVADSADQNRRNRRIVEEALTAAELAWVPSQANFILVRFASQVAAEWFEMLKARQIYTRLVRGAPDCLRISVGTEAQCTKLARAIKQVTGGASV